MSDMDKALALTHIVMSNFRDQPCRCAPNTEGTHENLCAPFSFLKERGHILIALHLDADRLRREEGAPKQVERKPEAQQPKARPNKTLPW